MNYADLRKYDTANGSGIGTTIFVSGCNFHCSNCFNRSAWNFNFGQPFTKEVEDKLIDYAKDVHVNHVSLLGGEIFHQDLNIILHLVKRIKEEVNKPIYVWTGFTWEELLKDDRKIEILKYIDVLTDGRFEQNKKDMSLLYKGSTNQMCINVPATIKQNKIIEHSWKVNE